MGTVAMKSQSNDDESLCLVKECRELGTCYGTNLTDDILADAHSISRRAVRRMFLSIDKEKFVSKCNTQSSSTAYISKMGGSWPKLWDSALHLGPRHTIGLQNLSRILAYLWFTLVPHM